MKFERDALASGGTVVDGFKLDGKFIGVEPIPNYGIFRFEGSEEVQGTFFVIDWKENYYLELISIQGGQVRNGSSSIQLTKIENFYDLAFYLNTPNDFLIFSKPDAYLPFSFAPGILISPNSSLTISLVESVTNLTLVCKPVQPIQLGVIRFQV